jgi:transcription initiation factor TFIID subunit 6
LLTPLSAHWLAVEGVQPSIPQNPTATNHADLLPKGPNANPHLAAANGLDNVNVKPLVKHVLSKESQELFAKLSSALIDETNSEWQNAALASIQSDPGIHQLTTYLITFIAEKVTHSLKNLFVLRQMMLATTALLNNASIYLDPYIAYMVAPVLTCCTGKHLGPHQVPSNASSETLNGNVNGNPSNNLAHFELRDLAASILEHMCRKYSASNQGLKARVARICLKQFMDPNKPLGTHYGALRALLQITGTEGMKMLVLPNLIIYDTVLKEALADDSKRPEAERVIAVILQALDRLDQRRGPARANGVADMSSQKDRLTEKVGEVIAEKLLSSGRSSVAHVILDSDLSL